MATYKKFDGHPKAQAWIVHDDYGVYLMSYNTIVCGIRDTVNSGPVAFCNGTYSATTIKHIGWFAKMFLLNYYTFKALARDNMVMDMDTGEVFARSLVNF